MAGTTTIHWIKMVTEGCFPAVASTYCGKRGFSEGSNEWTTDDGRESRFEAQPLSQGVTCKRCLKSIERAKNRATRRIR